MESEFHMNRAKDVKNYRKAMDAIMTNREELVMGTRTIINSIGRRPKTISLGSLLAQEYDDKVSILEEILRGNPSNTPKNV